MNTTQIPHLWLVIHWMTSNHDSFTKSCLLEQYIFQFHYIQRLAFHSYLQSQVFTVVIYTSGFSSGWKGIEYGWFIKSANRIVLIPNKFQAAPAFLYQATRSNCKSLFVIETYLTWLSITYY